MAELGARAFSCLHTSLTERDGYDRRISAKDFGRTLSSSYVPEAAHPNYQPMLAELERIFQTRQQEGKVEVEYVTLMHYGQLI